MPLPPYLKPILLEVAVSVLRTLATVLNKMKRRG